MLSPQELNKKAVDRCIKDLKLLCCQRNHDLILRCLIRPNIGGEDKISPPGTLYQSLALELVKVVRHSWIDTMNMHIADLQAILLTKDRVRYSFKSYSSIQSSPSHVEVYETPKYTPNYPEF